MTTTSFRVIDAIMGAGKTTHVINELRKPTSAHSRHIVITPYLKEVERFQSSVPELKFSTPDNKKTSKLTDFHRLVGEGKNIVSTHQLFKQWDIETLQLLQAQGYQLIIDETVDCTRNYGIEDGEPDPADVMFLIDAGFIYADETGKLHWKATRKPGNNFVRVKEDCDAGRLFFMNSESSDGLMFWEFPIRLLETFQSVTVLTYMFNGSLMSSYLASHGIKPKLMTIDNKHQLVPWSLELEAQASSAIAPLINLLDDANLNEVGDDYYAFSSGWFKRQTRRELLSIAKQGYNVLQNRMKATSKNTMWSCVAENQKSIAPKSYKKAFVSCNLRATNELSDRSNLAYFRNVFMNPTLWNIFTKMRGITPDQDRYALAELLQWVFRSAIRNGQPINLYLPSRRMRELLIAWMNHKPLAAAA